MAHIINAEMFEGIVTEHLIAYSSIEKKEIFLIPFIVNGKAVIQYLVSVDTKARYKGNDFLEAIQIYNSL